jgi:hypothetical protein
MGYRTVNMRGTWHGNAEGNKAAHILANIKGGKKQGSLSCRPHELSPQPCPHEFPPHESLSMKIRNVMFPFYPRHPLGLGYKGVHESFFP